MKQSQTAARDWEKQFEDLHVGILRWNILKAWQNKIWNLSTDGEIRK